MRLAGLLCLVFAAGASAGEPLPDRGLVLWLDGRDVDANGQPDPAADGQRLREWRDRSGGANHVRQDRSDRQPGRSTGAVRFESQQTLTLGKLTGFDRGDQPFHAFVVLRSAKADSQTNPRLLDFQSTQSLPNGSRERTGFWIGHQGNGRNRLGIKYGDEGEASRAAWTAEPQLLEVVYHGSQRWSQGLNGEPAGNGLFAERTFLGFQGQVEFAIGQHVGLEAPNTFYNGELLEVLLYNRPLSLAETNFVGQYLSERHGLSTAYGPAPVFETEIAPLLKARCHRCHAEDLQEGGLDLRTMTALIRGGSGGPVVVPGHPEHSALLDLTASGKMPPKGPRLSPSELALIRRWIALGAPSQQKVMLPDPHDRITAADRRHWAFVPLAASGGVSPPMLSPSLAPPENPVDAFLLAKLSEKGLAFSAQADRRTLMRRLSFDLLGLPSDPELVDEFAADERPEAWDRLVDRFLSSPQFGERWGRHWLDAAGYVDTYGTDNDAGIIKVLPGRWRYRDYVVRAFNDDKPFDRFLTEQLAGDELYAWRTADAYTPEMFEALVATGFLLSAADDTDAPELNTPDVRHRVLQLTGEIVGSNLFGLTIACAKCHDHKYEPISQQDYYRWMAGFAGPFNPEQWTVSTGHVLADVPPAAKARIDEQNRQVDSQSAQAQSQTQTIRARVLNRLQSAKLDRLPAVLRGDLKEALATPDDRRNPIQKYLASRLGPEVAVSGDEIEKAFTDLERREIGELNARIATLQRDRRTYETIQAVFEPQAPLPIFVLRRGEHDKPSLPAPPAIPAVLDVRASTAVELAVENSSGRRLRFAKQIADVSTPAGSLLVRVQVNRVWQNLFGRGIVESSENFGVSGARPTHPELLDWMSARFVADGWRLKPLIRMLVTSRAYRQASSTGVSPDETRGAAVDPDNRLLWRMPLRRLPSEAVRDSLLAVAGRLNPRMGGAPVPLQNHPDGSVSLDEKSAGPGDLFRRSLYVLSRRNYQLTMLATFDQPVVSTNCTRREASAVVTQSLTMLNDPFVRDQSRALAARVKLLAGDDPARQVRTAFRLAFTRAPSPSELASCVQFLSESKNLEALSHTLLNTSEFLYVP